MTPTDKPTDHRIPAGQAAVKLRMTRDKVVRLIQRGTLTGSQDPDSLRWYVDAGSLATYAHTRNIPDSQ